MSFKASNNSSQENTEKPVFLQSKPTNNLVLFLKFIKTHAVTEYGSTGQVIRTLTELEIPKPSRPTVPPGQNPDRFDEMEYSNALRNYDAQVQVHKERKIKLFAKIMSFTSLASRAIIEAQPNYLTCEQNSDLIGLMEIISATHRPYAGLDALSRKTAMLHELTDMRQAADQATATYCHAYREKVRLALEAGVDLSNEQYFANIFLNSLNSHHAAYRNHILDPTLNNGKVPDTIEEAICLIEKHETFKQDSQRHMQANRRGASSAPAKHVVAAATVQSKGKKKGKGKSAEGSSNAKSSGGRPPCPHCARVNPNHSPDMCYSKPGNESKRAAHEAKRGAANAGKRDKIKTAMLAALSDLFLNEQP